MDAQEALRKLAEGNARFVANRPTQKDFAAQRAAVVAGQKPYAVVLYCSDSRVPAEHIFDAGIGEIFGVRDAGNIADQFALGSIEYAVGHLHTPLLVVMGHAKCGAVAAACASNHAEGNVDAVVREIQPAVKAGGKDPQKTVSENVKCVLSKIRSKSSILSHLEKEGRLKILGAVYSLETGAVSFL
jgi:carbonic anhydrase